MKRIVALDPGGTTGVAILYHDDKALRREAFQLGPEDHHLELSNLLVSAYHSAKYLAEGGITIVCESFEYRNRAREGLVLSSVEYIGVVKLFGQTHNCPVVFQSASMGKVGADDSKAFVKRKNLEKLGVPWTYALRHQADATGHALYYMLHNPDFVREHKGNSKIKMDILKQGWK
jgi:hypothetical protein